jgi:hypothetical protein
MTLLSSTSLAARPDASVVLRTSAAEQGGKLHVMARMRHAVRHTSFLVTGASVGVGAGPTPNAVTMRHAGKSMVWHGKFAVDAAIPVGTVLLVRIDYTVNGTEGSKEVSVNVVAPDPNP